MKIGIILPVAVLSVFLFSCTTAPVQKTARADTVIEENARFLAAQPESSDELFRIVMMSDAYDTVQKSSTDTIKRTEDKNGDKYMCEELNKFDKINEAREAVLSVSLYPDTGRIMKIRPKRLAALRELDELVVEDLQRWNFVSPKKRQIAPLKFDVRYRIVLRKKQSDEEIIKEVREKMKEKASQ